MAGRRGEVCFGTSFAPDAAATLPDADAAEIAAGAAGVRLVFLCNRLVLVNELPHDVVYMQPGTSPTRQQLRGQTVGAGKSIVFHWPSRRHKRELQLRVLLDALRNHLRRAVLVAVSKRQTW